MAFGTIAADVAELMDNFRCQVKVVGYVESESKACFSITLCCSTCISGYFVLNQEVRTININQQIYFYLL